jgi:PBP1b-binding outer membrane lipoprotein LpoB
LGGDAAMKQTLSILAQALLLTGCGGTYVDDKRNFERSFGSETKRGRNGVETGSVLSIDKNGVGS